MGVERSVVTKHLGNIFKEDELKEEAVYAIKVLKEYTIKSFVLDDERLKHGEQAFTLTPHNYVIPATAGIHF